MQTVFLQGRGSNDINSLNCLGSIWHQDRFDGEAFVPDYHCQVFWNYSNGPYLAHLSSSDITFAPIYHVYCDELQASMSGILPKGTEGNYQYATVNTVNGSTAAIPVNSRLCYLNAKTAARPFNGWRVTVKDVTCIGGAKTQMATGHGSSCMILLILQLPLFRGQPIWAKTWSARRRPCSLQMLVEWRRFVDYHDTFNPRADGYQDTGVSLLELDQQQLDMTGLICQSAVILVAVSEFQHPSKELSPFVPPSAPSRMTASCWKASTSTAYNFTLDLPIHYNRLARHGSPTPN